MSQSSGASHPACIALATVAHAGDIHKVAGDAIKIHHVDADAVAGMLAELARVPLDILILDADAGALERDVQRYRLARPAVRLILFAPGRIPGDRAIANLVATCQLTDVVTDASELPAALVKPGDFLSALRWLSPDLATPGKGSTSAPEARVVVRKVATTSRPVIITVSSIFPAAGTTTTAVGLASWLACRGHKVALVEVDNAEYSGVFSLFSGPPNSAGVATWSHGMTSWTLSSPAEIRRVLDQKAAEYLVLDDARRFDPLWLSLGDIRVLCVPDCSWRLRWFDQFATRVCNQPWTPGDGKVTYPALQEFSIVVSGRGTPIVREYFGTRDEDVYYAGHIDLDSALKDVAAAVDMCAAKLLDPYLPDAAPRNRIWQRFRLGIRHRRRRYQAVPPAPPKSPMTARIGIVFRAMLDTAVGFVMLALPWLFLLAAAYILVTPSLRLSCMAWLESLATRLGIQH